ncbi:ABC transporter ATP-binding protein [Candidatus Gracilibacteria bacterium]|nr:ABC transporter ATP-binding protein [Candidatus Gracilibacteria bacterium]
MEPVISLVNLSKTIGKSKILHNISLSITKGQVYGFLGPNGAGKTTTMKAILGIIAPTSGHVEIFGSAPNHTKVQSRLGFMPENTYLYKYLTGDEFLAFNGGFYDLSKNKIDERKTWVLEKVGLEHVKNKRLNSYSKGMLQRIGLAQSILHDPEIIFLDEPMSGLDPIGRKMVKDLMLELKNDGKTIFFNTHILSDVEAICDSFGIICEGKLVADMKIEELEFPLEDFFMKKIKENSTRNYIE